MNDLVFVQNEAALTNSLLVAEKFGKRHDNVLRDIRNLMEGLPKSEETPLFDELSYTDSQNGQKYPM